jgi:proteasome accessory factor A
MAFPKVCGIENEFSFFVRDANGQPVSEEQFRAVLTKFVRSFLRHKCAIQFDKSKEARRTTILNLKDLDMLLEEVLHDALVGIDAKDTDGFLENGARFYIDAFHPEYSTPECLQPLDLVAHDKASELILMDAVALYLNQLVGSKYQVVIHKNNSDGNGNSYGSHLNMLMDRKLVRDKQSFLYFFRRYVPFQIARMVLIGGGKLGSENSAPPCAFQISQRADFFERLLSSDTVSKRPIFNTRDEPHATSARYFRLHDISTDALMCEHADFLRVALTQVVLAMIEDKFLEKDLFPRDPIAAMWMVSRDISFKQLIRMENSRKSMTGYEMLQYYLDAAEKYLALHPMTDAHCRAVALAQKLMKALAVDPLKTFGYLDWTTSLAIAESRPRQARDFLLSFREVSPDGLYYQLMQKGKIYRLLDDETIRNAKTSAPADTRARIRSFVITHAAERLLHVNWSEIHISMGGLGRECISLDNPLFDQKDLTLLQLKLGL